MKAIVLPIGVGIAGQSAENNGNVINIKDAYLDDRFSSAYDKISGYRTRSILCVPVFLPIEQEDDDEGQQSGTAESTESTNPTSRGPLIGVMQLINSLNNGKFNDDDIIMMEEFCSFISDKLRRQDVLPIVDSMEESRDDAHDAPIPPINRLASFTLQINR